MYILYPLFMFQWNRVMLEKQYQGFFRMFDLNRLIEVICMLVIAF
jgi:hypothetical protein